LPGGGRMEFTGWFNIPTNLAKGDYHLIYIADANNTVPETVEWNNRISTVISVTDQFVGEDPSEAREANPIAFKEAAAEGFAPNLSISPNPVAGMAMLTFSMPVEARLGLKVFNVSGRMVEEMPERMVDAGEYALPLDLSGLPNGVYVATIEVEGAPVISKKVMVQH
jgi:Secretion system C-terminal sorting domain/CARDB